MLGEYVDRRTGISLPIPEKEEAFHRDMYAKGYDDCLKEVYQLNGLIHKYEQFKKGEYR